MTSNFFPNVRLPSGRLNRMNLGDEKSIFLKASNKPPLTTEVMRTKTVNKEARMSILKSLDTNWNQFASAHLP